MACCHPTPQPARAIVWIFATVGTLEQPAVDLEVNQFFEQDQPWGAKRRPAVERRLRDRLADLAARLGDGDWLEGSFTAGDLMTVEVLLRVESELAAFPNLVAYVDRARARPAFKRAFAAQKAVADAARASKR